MPMLGPPTASDGEQFQYTVADASNCHGALSFDDRDLGINNQLFSYSFMLCMANLTGACSLHTEDFGYRPCGTHMPGEREGRRCKVTQNHAAVDIRKLLRLPADVEALLKRGDAFEDRAQRRFVGPCRRDEDGKTCHTCGPYSQNPFNCARDANQRVGRVNIIYAYGLKYHLRNRRDSTKPHCPMMRLTLHDDVERYSRELMARLHLVPGEFVAAQYRTGWAWRVHTRKINQDWSCYGMATINATLARLSRREPIGGNLLAKPLFLLTNIRNLHAATVPVPIQVLSEIRITSLAHTVLLNPMSSFQEAVVQMRGGRDRLHFVTKKDTVRNDHCGCSAADEQELQTMGKLGEFRNTMCTNSTAFELWMREVRDKELELIRRRRELMNATSSKNGR